MKARSLKLPTSNAFAVNRDESLLVALGKNVAVGDLDRLVRAGSWKALPHMIYAGFSDDSKTLAVKNTLGQIALLRILDGQIISPAPPDMYDEGCAVNFSACGDFLVDGSWSGSIRIRKTADLKPFANLDFKDEQITVACRSVCGSRWLFAHQPHTEPGKRFSAAPYCTLWTWPLTRPTATFACGTDTLDAAALSPDGKQIAVSGYRRSVGETVLAVLNQEGSVIAETDLSNPLCGSIRWSRCGRFVSGAQESGFFVRNAKSLNETLHIPAQNPSDLILLNSGMVAIGTWESGVVKVLPEWADTLEASDP